MTASPRRHPRPSRRLSLAAGALLSAAALTACSSGATQRITNVRVAPPVQSVQQGDCAEAYRRAVARPDLPVDRLPEPVRMQPAPLQKVPPGALRKDGSAIIRARVVIDTLGRADMKTFAVDEASHPWFAADARTVIRKWSFRPAVLAGCKVPRVYLYMASAPARDERGGAKVRKRG